jgi:hypothetical protein
MLPLVLLFIFWAVVPGLITGWMFRERGRRFAPGLLLGTVCGPLGILAALAFLYAAERRYARERKAGRARAVRVFYDIPVVGRLHVSTVWALAGLATFLCLWMVGGIGYDLYSERLEQSRREAAAAEATPGAPQAREGAAPNTPRAAASSNDSRAVPAQEGITNQPRAALLGNISAPPGQAANANARPDNSAPALVQPAWPDASAAARTSQPEAKVSAPSPSPAQAAGAPAASAKATGPSREAAVSEVTRALSSQGHRVHAALSGDAQTSTLSLSGESLTREAGNQLLGNRRLRESLKAAGVRIVVMVNGQESWTYIL